MYHQTTVAINMDESYVVEQRIKELEKNVQTLVHKTMYLEETLQKMTEMISGLSDMTADMNASMVAFLSSE